MSTLSISIERSADDEEVEAVRAALAELGVEAEVAANYGRKAVGADDAAILFFLAMLYTWCKSFTEASGKKAGDLTTEEAFVQFKKLVTKAIESRKHKPEVIVQDDESGVTFVNFDEVPEEGIRELGQCLSNLQAAAGEWGSLKWADGRWWRQTEENGSEVVDGWEPINPSDWVRPN